MTLPLDGVRVLDLTRILAGPFATMKLADMGAEVIKIERPGTGDDTRGWGPPFVGDVSTYFLSINRNKKSLTLNLKHPEGKAILTRLIRTSDVLVENFRPGTLARLGFDEATLREENEQLIYASISGYGHESDNRERASYDLIVQGESGVMDVTGQADGPPTKFGLSIADEVAGMLCVEGILLALLKRERTGTGDRVDIALFDGMMSMLTYHSQMALSSEQKPRRRGNRHPSIVPYETFRTADGFLNVGVGSRRLWEQFCRVIERFDLKRDPRFETNEDRVRNRKELIPILDTIFLERSTADWYDALTTAGIPCGFVNSVPKACQLAARDRRGLIWDLPHPESGSLKTVGNPVRIESNEALPKNRPPDLGQDTDALLADLGYDSEQIDALREAETI